MKKISILFSFVFFCFALFAKTNLAVMQGPTGIGAVYCDKNIHLTVLSSPNEAVARLINGELDMAALPANTALSLYNKGVKIKAVAVVSENMLCLLGNNINSEELYIPGAGGSPETVADKLYPSYKKNFSIASPAQLAQMLIAGKIQLAVLPEPFVSMAVNKNPSLEVFEKTNTKWQFPMTILVVNESYATKHKKETNKAIKEFKESLQKVLDNPKEASVKIEELLGINASLAQNAVAGCNLCFKTDNTVKQQTYEYFKEINMPFNPNFWL